MPRDAERFWRTTQNLRRFEYGPRATTLVRVQDAIDTALPVPLTIPLGGTGAITAPAALANLGAAPLASPVFTGDPRAPTPATGDSDTSIATTAYVQAQGYATSVTVTAGDNLRVLKSGDTMSGSLLISTASGWTNVSVRSATGNRNQLLGFIGPNLRWEIDLGDGTAESTGNAGSNFGIARYNDAGVGIDYPLTISRATGAVKLVGPLTVSNNANPTLAVVGDYTVVYSPDGTGVTGGIVIGNAAGGAGITYNRQTNHLFQDRSGSATFAQFIAAGTYNASGSWIVFSGRELKEDVASYERGLEAILALNPVAYRYREGTPFASGRSHVGLMAEDVAAHIPEMVGEAEVEAGVVVPTLSPGDLIYVLVNAVKELSARLAMVEQRT